MKNQILKTILIVLTLVFASCEDTNNTLTKKENQEMMWTEEKHILL